MIIAFSFDSLYGSNPASDNIKLVELRCEYATNPLGIDVKTPKFSWILESTERGQMQSAYQVLVASSLDNLQNEVGDNWDSKKVKLSNSVNISYKGKLLISGKKYYWKVRIWDNNGKVSDWSAPATFKMGLMKPEDWEGKWIGTRLQ